MADDLSFRELIERVRGRDEQAAAELVRRYETTIRMAIRVRLSDPALRRLYDSVDICQSVLANFFARAAAGQFELNTADELLRLLLTMARNKLTDCALQQQAACRDCRRLVKGSPDDLELADTAPSPSQVVAHRDLLEALRSRLSAEERRLADQRALGRTWVEIAAEERADPDALRSRLSRALDRVAQELHLGE